LKLQEISPKDQIQSMDYVNTFLKDGASPSEEMITLVRGQSYMLMKICQT